MKKTFTMLLALSLCVLTTVCIGCNKVSGDDAEVIVTESPLEGMSEFSESTSYSVNPNGSTYKANMYPLERLALSLAGQMFPDKIIEAVNFPDSLKDKKVSVFLSVPYPMDSREAGAILYEKMADTYGIRLDSVVRDISGYKLSVADKEKLSRYKTATRRGGSTGRGVGVDRNVAEFKNITIGRLADELGAKDALNALVYTDEQSRRGYDFEFGKFDDLEVTKSELEKYGLSLEESGKKVGIIIVYGSGENSSGSPVL